MICCLAECGYTNNSASSVKLSTNFLLAVHIMIIIFSCSSAFYIHCRNNKIIVMPQPLKDAFHELDNALNSNTSSKSERKRRGRPRKKENIAKE